MDGDVVVSSGGCAGRTTVAHKAGGPCPSDVFDGGGGFEG